jgi:hypothetical protein
MRTIVILVGFVVVLISATNFAQDTGPQMRARLYVGVIQIGFNPYGQPMKASALVLQGEPLVLEIGIGNPYEDREVGAESNWPALVSATVHLGDIRSKERTERKPLRCTNEPTLQATSQNIRTRNDLVVIPRQRDHQFFTCNVDLANLDLLTGIYTVDVDWGPTADMSKLAPRAAANGLKGSVDVEFRNVSTEADTADVLIRRGYRAFLEGRTDDADKSINDLLLIRPLSSYGLAIRAMIRAKRGQCGTARADLVRASDILIRAQEPDDANRRGDDERGAITVEWRRMVRQLGCSPN